MPTIQKFLAQILHKTIKKKGHLIDQTSHLLMHHLKYSPLSIFITKHSMINSIRLLSTQASNNLTHYQILDIPATASIKEIKLQFKKLLKKYHPDLNQHLSDDERDAIKEKYMQMISSYEVLKDLKRKSLRSINQFES